MDSLADFSAEVWTDTELTQFLRVCRTTTHNWRKAIPPKGPAFFTLPNGEIRYLRSAVFEWIQVQPGHRRRGPGRPKGSKTRLKRNRNNQAPGLEVLQPGA